MMTYNEAFYQLKVALSTIYDLSEAVAISHEVMEYITGLDKLGRLMVKETPLNPAQSQDWLHIKAELLTGKPMQQVLGYAWFMGRKYEVNEQVLIPRPETEELVQWIIDDWHEKANQFTLLDIGTGSGCIPVSLAGALPNAVIHACDISDEALKMAKKNAMANEQAVHFFKTNILNNKNWEILPMYDVIVSNPPYIPISERTSMPVNVRDYDPHLALFVPDEDPLIFYKAIASMGLRHLQPGGAVYCEIHQDYGLQTEKMFQQQGYKTILRKDLFDNQRMIKLII